MARGATLTGTKPVPVTARSASDEAVSTITSGDCFVGRKRRSLLAEAGQMDVISSARLWREAISFCRIGDCLSRFDSSQ